MTPRLSPLDYANAVARNIVPLAGIVLLGWSAPTVLVLYFVDTLLAMAVMFAGLARHFLPPPTREGWAARANAEVGYVGAALLIAAMFAIPLGVPLIFVFAGSNADWKVLLADPQLRAGLMLQAIAAFWSGRDLYRALRVHTPDELRLKRRFALVFLRWMALLMFVYLGIGFFFGPYGALFYVAVYIAATIVTEIAPDRFLKAMPGGADEADPPRSPGSNRPHQSGRKHRRGKR